MTDTHLDGAHPRVAVDVSRRDRQAKLLVAARIHPDPFVRLVVEMLARTGLRTGELLDLTIDAVVLIGTHHWLRVPVGKLHTDRYIPLHPAVQTLLDTGSPPVPTRCGPTCCSSTAAGASPAAVSSTRSPTAPNGQVWATSPRTSCGTRWPPRRSTAGCHSKRSPGCWATTA